MGSGNYDIFKVQTADPFTINIQLYGAKGESFRAYKYKMSYFNKAIELN